MLGAEDVKKITLETPQTETQVKEVTPGDNTVLDNVVLHSQVGQQLGLASLEVSKYSYELDQIIDWARSNGAKTMEDIIYEIRYLSNTIGQNSMEKKIKTVARYVFLANEKNRINTEIERLKSYER
jgi:hypothetical protein